MLSSIKKRIRRESELARRGRLRRRNNPRQFSYRIAGGNLFFLNSDSDFHSALEAEQKLPIMKYCDRINSFDP